MREDEAFSGRDEDEGLVTGGDPYADDLWAEGQLHCYFLRSPVAHGKIRTIDYADAAARADIALILDGGALDAAGIEHVRCTLPLENADGSAMRAEPRPHLAREIVRYVGEPILAIFAESPNAARDAAEMVELDIEDLEPLVAPEAALAANGPSLDWAFHTDDDEEAVGRAFDQADQIVELGVNDQRLVIAPMESRAILAQWDEAAARYRLDAPSQGVWSLRNGLAKVMGLEPEQIRVVTPRVGGSFGLKGGVFAELPPILLAARRLGRPIKWADQRSDSFLSDFHGRAMDATLGLALSKDGDFLAARADVVGDMGAYVSPFGPYMPSGNIRLNFPGAYKTPRISVRTRCVETNTTYIGPYRGAGRPDGVFFMERLVDEAARQIGMDPVAIRRRNLVAPEALPYRAASGQVYDSGAFEALMDKALARADWDGFERREAADRAKGLWRGRGLATYLQVTAGASKEMGGIVFEESGRVRFVTGTLDYGQGHSAGFLPIVADGLGIDRATLDLAQRDSDQLIAGGGTGGSRSAMASAAAAQGAVRAVIELGKLYAARKFEAAVDDVAFDRGVFSIKGSDLRAPIMELAREARANPLPEAPAGMNAELVVDTPPAAFPNGAHAAEITIDPETGKARLERYVAIDDFGRILDHRVAQGQMHGGVVQGLSQALFEGTVYDDSGQLLTGSFMDYHLPRADDLCALDLDFDQSTPAQTSASGIKGLGEAGPCGGLASVANALADALHRAGADPKALAFPATPQRLWRLLRGAKR